MKNIIKEEKDQVLEEIEILDKPRSCAILRRFYLTKTSNIKLLFPCYSTIASHYYPPQASTIQLTFNLTVFHLPAPIYNRCTNR